MADPLPLPVLLEGREPEELKVPLVGLLDGADPVVIHCVLQRTVVYEPIPPAGREVARQERLHVDPDQAQWRPVRTNYRKESTQRGHEQSSASREMRGRSTFNSGNRRPDPEQSRKNRQRSDARARRGG